MSENNQNNRKRSNPKRIVIIVILEVLIIIALFVAYRWFIMKKTDNNPSDSKNIISQDVDKETTGQSNTEQKDNNNATEELSAEEKAALEEQEKLKAELKEREELVAKAERLALGYYYDEAMELIQSYQGSEGSYAAYPLLTEALERLETEKNSLLLYGGSYDSVTKINHIFFHSLIVDTSKAFDGEGEARGYNMYMATVSEFQKILRILYEDGYVLVNISDLTKKVKEEDGSTKYVEGDIYLREGKKPLVISQDDVSYYKYMDGDGFATRIVLDENGKPTCEMLLEDGTVTTGAFDMVPLIDQFVEEHPDFSYRGAKGLIALTGYEGILGYRTNDETSPTYEEDKKAAKEVADAMKAEGWEFGSHSWGHKNMQKISLELLKTDTNRWLKEVKPLIGETDIFIFPFGVDIENTIKGYVSDKYHFLKDSGFNVFLGVDSKPWMQVRKDYIRMTRRPIDGQAMLQFPERLKDLFTIEEVIDPNRPPRDW
jgi:hypothetical protein